MLSAYNDMGTLMVFAGLFAITYVYYNRTSFFARNGNLQNGPPALKSYPLIGSLLSLPHPETMHLWFLERLPTLGGVIGLKVSYMYCVFIQTREALNEAYLKHSRISAGRPVSIVDEILNVEKRGIIDRQYDEVFKKYHKLTLSCLRALGFGDHSVMEARIHREVDNLITEFEDHQSKPFYPLTIVNGSVVNVIASILFGRRFELSDTALNDLISNVNSLSRTTMNLLLLVLFPILRFIPVLRRNMQKAKQVHDWVLDFGRRNIESALLNDSEASFVGGFADAEGRDRFDREELLYIVRDLIVAGSETSSTMVMWAIVVLAEHRDVQTRLHQELDAVVGVPDVQRDGGNGRRLPSLGDRSKLPFVEATVLELMRYKTIVPLAIPRVTTGDVEIHGYRIPPGTMVLPSIYALHNDPNVWDNPRMFKPDRFLDGKGNIINREKVIPFSIGKRSCLGEILARQEIFLFIAGLVHNFDILPPEGQDSLNCTEVSGITFAPSPYTVRMIPRNGRKTDL